MENYLKLPAHYRRFAELIVAGKNAADAIREVRPRARCPKQSGWQWRNFKRVKAAIAELEAEAIERGGITILQVLLDANTIKRRCMQAEPVRDSKGKPTGEYRFDSAGANKANEFLGKYLKIAPERHEVAVSAIGDAAKEAAQLIREANDPNLAAQTYGDLMTGRKSAGTGS